MTITQLRIIVLTAQHGSISAASRELGIPQPNASSGIKAIEKELGFEIFNRNNGGIVLTEKGQLFLEHAQKIITENDHIIDLSKMEHIFQLRVGCSNFYKGRDAFVKICAEHKDEALADLKYLSVSVEDGIKLLYEHKLDIVIGLTVDKLVPTLTEMAKNKRVQCLTLADTVPTIRLRKDHDLVKDAPLDGEDFDTNLLRDYPYIAYFNLTSDFETPYYKAVFTVPCKYAQFVEETETRYRLVANTNGFSLGGKLPQETLDQYGLVQYDYPGYVLKMVCFFRKGDEDRPEINRYIELLNT